MEKGSKLVEGDLLSSWEKVRISQREARDNCEELRFISCQLLRVGVSSLKAPCLSSVLLLRTGILGPPRSRDLSGMASPSLPGPGLHPGPLKSGRLRWKRAGGQVVWPEDKAPCLVLCVSLLTATLLCSGNSVPVVVINPGLPILQTGWGWGWREKAFPPGDLPEAPAAPGIITLDYKPQCSGCCSTLTQHPIATWFRAMQRLSPSLPSVGPGLGPMILWVSISLFASEAEIHSTWTAGERLQVKKGNLLRMEVDSLLLWLWVSLPRSDILFRLSQQWRSETDGQTGWECMARLGGAPESWRNGLSLSVASAELIYNQQTPVCWPRLSCVLRTVKEVASSLALLQKTSSQRDALCREGMAGETALHGGLAEPPGNSGESGRGPAAPFQSSFPWS